MMNNKVNLYGTGINAAKFLMMNGNIDIGLVIEGREKKINQSPEFFGYKVILLPEAVQELKHSYTVIGASEKAFWEIKATLESYGLVEYEHFEYYETYHKKVAFVYGNCHTEPIKEALRHSKEFTLKYGVYPMPPVQDIKSQQINLADFPLEHADIFIHQCIWEKNFYGLEYASSSLISRLKSDCKVVGIPNLYRMPKFLFPQIPEEFDQKYYSPFGNTSYFNFRDKYIDDNYGMPIDYLYKLMENESLISVDKIRSEEEKFYTRLMEREKGWDIKMSLFFRDNMKREQCFYDPNHPTPFVMNYIILRLFKILDFDMSYDAGALDMSTYELPIYATVRRAIGLQYSKSILRKNGLKLFSIDMDKKEYIRQYLAWNHSGWKPNKVEHIVYRR